MSSRWVRSPNPVLLTNDGIKDYTDWMSRGGMLEARGRIASEKTKALDEACASPKGGDTGLCTVR
jgi:hypothetical protein